MAAQSKKPYLTKAERAAFREALLEKRRQISGDVSRLEDETVRAGEETDYSVDHMADHGSFSFDQDQTIGIIERESDILRAIDLALEKLRNGTYGQCDDCSGRIKKTRLKALPYAHLCLACQMKREQS